MLKAHIHRQAGLSGKDWLLEGWRIWQLPSFAFARDYMIPRANSDLSGTVCKLAEYTDVAVNGRALLQQLRVPKWSTERHCHSA